MVRCEVYGCTKRTDGLMDGQCGCGRGARCARHLNYPNGLRKDHLKCRGGCGKFLCQACRRYGRICQSCLDRLNSVALGKIPEKERAECNV